jgi:hypothetical protein
MLAVQVDWRHVTSKAPGATNDHFVPQMYLRRWGTPTNKGHQIVAAKIDTLDNSFITSVRNVASEKGFYWGETPDGVPHHEMERFLTLIEDEATPAFRAVLDSGKKPDDDALARPWPPRLDVRLKLSWWIAAQILRTARRRELLWRTETESAAGLRSFARTNLHIDYIIQNVGPIAQVVFQRPWGIGYTTACLATSDSPVQVFNAQDDDDQVRAVSFWDIYLPLDPHRFLYLPGESHQDRRSLMRDHRIGLPGGLAIGLNSVVAQTAHRHIFWHKEHDPRKRLDRKSIASIRSNRTKDNGFGGFMMNYNALSHPQDGIQRRWLDNHDLPSRGDAREQEDQEDVRKVVEHSLQRLDETKKRYNSLSDG